MILKEKNKNKTKLLGTPADNKHEHNAGDKRADVIKRPSFPERMAYCWKQFIKAYVTSSLKVKKGLIFFFNSVSLKHVQLLRSLPSLFNLPGFLRAA